MPVTLARSQTLLDTRLLTQLVRYSETGEVPQYHNWVSLRDLMPKELQQEILPDYALKSIHVTFTSPTGNNYFATHVDKHPSGPYILLTSYAMDRADCAHVAEQMAEIVQGTWDENIGERGNGTDISTIIELSKTLKQKEVASNIKRYSEHFEDVSISSVHFHDVPDSDVRHAGAMFEKVQIEVRS